MEGRPEGWGPPDPGDREAWESPWVRVIVAVLLAIVIVGVVATTPVPPWYYAP